VSEQAFPDARRKIVGETFIHVDVVVKEIITKNTAKSVIHRTRTRALLLECGHPVEVTRFNKVPTRNTICHVCDLPRIQHEIQKLDEKLKHATKA
jgi:hypothetical protein